MVLEDLLRCRMRDELPEASHLAYYHRILLASRSHYNNEEFSDS